MLLYMYENCVPQTLPCRESSAGKREKRVILHEKAIALVQAFFVNLVEHSFPNGENLRKNMRGCVLSCPVFFRRSIVLTDARQFPGTDPAGRDARPERQHSQTQGNTQVNFLDQD